MKKSGFSLLLLCHLSSLVNFHKVLLTFWIIHTPFIRQIIVHLLFKSLHPNFLLPLHITVFFAICYDASVTEKQFKLQFKDLVLLYFTTVPSANHFHLCVFYTISIKRLQEGFSFATTIPAHLLIVISKNSGFPVNTVSPHIQRGESICGLV